MTPTISRITIGLLLIEIMGMWWLLSGNLPFAKSSLLTYHAIIALLVTYVTARIALQASKPQQFSISAIAVFLILFVIFNPFYPLLLTTVHTITADILAVIVLTHYARRLSVAANR